MKKNKWYDVVIRNGNFYIKGSNETRYRKASKKEEELIKITGNPCAEIESTTSLDNYIIFEKPKEKLNFDVLYGKFAKLLIKEQNGVNNTIFIGVNVKPLSDDYKKGFQDAVVQAFHCLCNAYNEIKQEK